MRNNYGPTVKMSVEHNSVTIGIEAEIENVERELRDARADLHAFKLMANVFGSELSYKKLAMQKEIVEALEIRAQKLRRKMLGLA